MTADDGYKCLILWQKVVETAVRDGLRYRAGINKDHDCWAADNWLTNGGRDYWHVMALAGIDGHFLRGAYVAGRISLKRLRSQD